jgi:hypothetical protein
VGAQCFVLGRFLYIKKSPEKYDLEHIQRIFVKKITLLHHFLNQKLKN